MIDPTDRLCMTYKRHQPDLYCVKRKYDHGFHQLLSDRSRTRVFGLNAKSLKSFIISDDNLFSIHDVKTFKKLKAFEVPLATSRTSDPIEILTMTLSEKEDYLGLLAGKI